ncbi:hypothetical protein GCM10023191_011410 [Actinoallomurus oryzae]|uniref:Restriction endonuclease n=1 Tax=Actinoallomurus oryzae TaxID=502180 RepID=A0ABP8PDZ5_9ACTN
MVNAISAIISLVAGWYGRDLLQFVRTLWARGTVARRRRLFEDKRSVALDWTIQYYRDHGDEEFLFQLPSGRRIAYLSRPSWRFPELNGRTLNFMLNHDRSDAPLDRKEIARRRRLGQKIWNGDVYFLDTGIGEGENFVRLRVRLGGYFQYLTLSGLLYHEALKCARSPRHQPKHRDRLVSTLARTQSGLARAQLLGFGVAMVFATPTGWKILVQQRAHEAGVAGGLQAVIPAYVIEPILDREAGYFDPFRDFLREISEELYSDRHQENPERLHPDWFYELDSIQKIIQLKGEGRFLFEVLGFGFDALTAELHFAAIAVVTDQSFAEHELRKMNRNWEATGVRLVDVASEEMTRVIESEGTYPTSAFVFACAREWLTAHGALDASAAGVAPGIPEPETTSAPVTGQAPPPGSS